MIGANVRIASLLFALAHPLSALAGSLIGEFKFTRRAPSVALVYFSEDNSLKEAGATVDQKDKQFVRKLMVGSSGSQIRFHNSDSVDHNIYANDAKTGAKFDAGLLPPGETSQTDLNWKQDEVVRIGCKIHPKMQAYIANIASVHHKIVEFEPKVESASFTLGGVPDKFSKIRVWFPKQDPIEVVMKKGEASQIDIIENGKVSGTLKLVRK